MWNGQEGMVVPKYLATLGVHEVSEAASALRNGKATGIDEIKPEMAKHSGMPGILCIHRILKLV